MTIDRPAVLRALRMDSADLEPALETRLADVERTILAAARPAVLWRLVPIRWADDGSYDVGPLHLASIRLRRELDGCRHAFLFCATLGAEVDARMRRYGVTSAADLALAQAAASVLIESHCDACMERMAADSAVAGERLRMRFAPGYGDLPLAVQRALLDALDAPRHLGVTLTDALMMVPTKSVSAIIGAGPERKTT